MTEENQEKDPQIQEEIPVEEDTANNVQDSESVSEKEENADQDKLKAEVEEFRDKYLRLYSEFENFRRRNAKERIELIQTANKDLIAELLPVLDDFDRAIQAMEGSEDVEAVKEGVRLVHQKFFKLLESRGLKPFESKEKEFNTEYHEAITEIPAPEDSLKGKVVDEIEKGYTLYDKVIRFARVVVGK